MLKPNAAPLPEATHDLEQARRDLDQVRAGNRADFLTHMLDQILDQCIVHLNALAQRHIGIDALSLHIMRIADHSRLCYCFMQN